MKPLAILDLETTGTNTATDAIVSAALYAPIFEEYWLCKPWKPIPKEVEELIGITNDQVVTCPPFSTYAHEIHEIISQCDIAGFNVRQFDIPMLYEEFYRCGIEWDLSNTLVIDAGVIFKKREERTLSAAMQFYCGKPHDGAHNALDDCKATGEVLTAQLERYPDLKKLDRAALALASEYEGPKRLSLDGKICLDDEGEAIFTFGKHKDTKTRVRDDIGYAEWMLKVDFPQQTKMVLNALLDQYRGEKIIHRGKGDLFEP